MGRTGDVAPTLGGDKRTTITAIHANFRHQQQGSWVPFYFICRSFLAGMLKRKTNMTSPTTEPQNKNDDKKLQVSAEMELAINDGQRLLTYISKNGVASLDPDLSQAIIDAKCVLANGHWSAEEENRFLINYDKLAKLVYPVTVESINAIIPQKSGQNGAKKPEQTKADKAVGWYRRYTMVALLLMLLAQLYFMLGYELRTNLTNMFEKREATNGQIAKMAKDEAQQAELEKSLEIQDQEFDANYKLLMLWNKVWLVGGGFDGKLPTYFAARYQHEKDVLNEQPEQNAEKLSELSLKRKLHEVRIVYFENIVSADFVLHAFQAYVLPLLYGLLGAFIYVLRSLMVEIKSLTYTFDSEIRFRLRLTLGALGGMIIGWFLKPDDAGAMASLSPMALAFLMGYNVDLLFTLMDKLVDNIKQSIDKPAKPAPAPPIK